MIDQGGDANGAKDRAGAIASGSGIAALLVFTQFAAKVAGGALWHAITKPRPEPQPAGAVA